MFALAVAPHAGAAAPPAPANRQIELRRLDAIRPLVAEAIDRGDLPGCVVAVGRTSGVAFLKAFGSRQLEPAVEEMTVDTVFDLASLTKPVATATCVMQLVERGKLRLQDKVASLLPGFDQNGKQAITVEQLLVHSAGFIPDNPLEDYDHGPTEAWRRINALAPQQEPGGRFVYSDVSFLVLGRIVEKLSGQPLHLVAQQRVFAPLGMQDTGFLPGESLLPRIAPTEKHDGRFLKGRVHDPRAARLGGVAGHAGLFGTAADLSRFARAMLAGGTLDGASILSPAGVAEMTRSRNVDGNVRALGWDVRSVYSRNRGELYSESAYGHGGFTGTGLWIDPDQDLFVVFLSNRLHPDGDGDVNDLIGRIGSIASASLTAAPVASP